MVRSKTFAKSRDRLLTMADQLGKLCGVSVAVVCADPDGGSLVMETAPGVLDRYRALPADRRAQHTHRRYLEDLLAKEKARLARVRHAGPDALAPPSHEQMSRMTLEELRRVSEAVEAAMAATAVRRRALGLPPANDDAAVVPFADGSDD